MPLMPRLGLWRLSLLWLVIAILSEVFAGLGNDRLAECVPSVCGGLKSHTRNARHLPGCVRHARRTCEGGQARHSRRACGLSAPGACTPAGHPLLRWSQQCEHQVLLGMPFTVRCSKQETVSALKTARHLCAMRDLQVPRGFSASTQPEHATWTCTCTCMQGCVVPILSTSAYNVGHVSSLPSISYFSCGDNVAALCTCSSNASFCTCPGTVYIHELLLAARNITGSKLQAAAKYVSHLSKCFRDAAAAVE